ncbi:hypothetical protein BU15DRAFT_64694 [Melanogaster broomeanus]|nr:hypothetical protein BU15DRAFT_64694 [Melanogaster broomeanus]
MTAKVQVNWPPMKSGIDIAPCRSLPVASDCGFSVILDSDIQNSAKTLFDAGGPRIHRVLSASTIRPDGRILAFAVIFIADILTIAKILMTAGEPSEIQPVLESKPIKAPALTIGAHTAHWELSQRLLVMDVDTLRRYHIVPILPEDDYRTPGLFTSFFATRTHLVKVTTVTNNPLKLRSLVECFAIPSAEEHLDGDILQTGQIAFTLLGLVDLVDSNDHPSLETTLSLVKICLGPGIATSKRVDLLKLPWAMSLSLTLANGYGRGICAISLRRTFTTLAFEFDGDSISCVRLLDIKTLDRIGCREIFPADWMELVRYVTTIHDASNASWALAGRANPSDSNNFSDRAHLSSSSDMNMILSATNARFGLLSISQTGMNRIDHQHMLSFFHGASHCRPGCLEDLPLDIIYLILDYLSPLDVIALSGVAKCYRAVFNDRAIWRRLYRRSTLPLPHGPYDWQSASDLSHALVMTAMVQVNWPPVKSCIDAVPSDCLLVVPDCGFSVILDSDIKSSAKTLFDAGGPRIHLTIGTHTAHWELSQRLLVMDVDTLRRYHIPILPEHDYPTPGPFTSFFATRTHLVKVTTVTNKPARLRSLVECFAIPSAEEYLEGDVLQVSHQGQVMHFEMDFLNVIDESSSSDPRIGQIEFSLLGLVDLVDSDGHPSSKTTLSLVKICLGPGIATSKRVDLLKLPGAMSLSLTLANGYGRGICIVSPRNSLTSLTFEFDGDSISHEVVAFDGCRGTVVGRYFRKLDGTS